MNHRSKRQAHGSPGSLDLPNRLGCPPGRRLARRGLTSLGVTLPPVRRPTFLGDPVLRRPPAMARPRKVTLAATREVTLSPCGRPNEGAPCPPAAGQTRGHPVLGRPATFSRGDPALRRPQVARHRRLRPSSPVQHRLLWWSVSPRALEKRRKNPKPRRHGPKRPRVTLSPTSGQLLRRRPASWRGKTPHQRPGDPLLWSHYCCGIHPSRRTLRWRSAGTALTGQ